MCSTANCGVKIKKGARMFTKKGPTYTLAGVSHLIVGIVMIASGNSTGWVFLILSIVWFILSRAIEHGEVRSDTKDVQK